MNFYEGKKGEEYFNIRVKRRDEFVQTRHAAYFQPHIKETDTVLDFGCGTGGILTKVNCAHKIGVEVNELSVIEAKNNNITIHPSLSKIKDNSIDVVMSNHAIEHVTNPADVIKEFKRILKQNGKAILVVPAESPYTNRFSKWKENDPDQHVFSWTPLSFGNLIAQCGLNIQESFYRPTGFSKYNRPLAKINKSLYRLSCHVVAFALKRYEVVCISSKP